MEKSINLKLPFSSCILIYLLSYEADLCQQPFVKNIFSQ